MDYFSHTPNDIQLDTVTFLSFGKITHRNFVLFFKRLGIFLELVKVPWQFPKSSYQMVQLTH
ncbi:hypothetical protein BZZ01_25710 [Nostocales cyanobacterium HT-58-2]|nr:hypothetical protein BZZ01_25710 [Nostocales cyanobacterium HT-58-2]